MAGTFIDLIQLLYKTASSPTMMTVFHSNRIVPILWFKICTVLTHMASLLARLVNTLEKWILLASLEVIPILIQLLINSANRKYLCFQCFHDDFG